MLDPGLKEEAARGGSLTVVANAHKELCAVHKADGIGLSLPQASALPQGLPVGQARCITCSLGECSPGIGMWL